MYFQLTKLESYLGKNDYSLQPLRVYIKAYGGKPAHNLGLCIAYMHNGHKIYRVLCQVTDTKGYLILDREQAQQMNYIHYSEIQPPYMHIYSRG